MYVTDSAGGTDGKVSPPATLAIDPSNTFGVDPYLASTSTADGVVLEYQAAQATGKGFAAVFDTFFFVYYLAGNNITDNSSISVMIAEGMIHRINHI